MVQCYCNAYLAFITRKLSTPGEEVGQLYIARQARFEDIYSCNP